MRIQNKKKLQIHSDDHLHDPRYLRAVLDHSLKNLWTSRVLEKLSGKVDHSLFPFLEYLVDLQPYKVIKLTPFHNH